MSDNENLHAAKENAKDEFYTQLSDIEAELAHYTEHFAGKTVYCNCDDPFESNFFQYFILNFDRLRLKTLIATSYYNSPVAQLDLFGNVVAETKKNPYWVKVRAVDKLRATDTPLTRPEIEKILATPQ